MANQITQPNRSSLDSLRTPTEKGQPTRLDHCRSLSSTNRRWSLAAVEIQMARNVSMLSRFPEPDGNPVNVESAESFEPLAATPADGDQPEIPGEGNFFQCCSYRKPGLRHVQTVMTRKGGSPGEHSKPKKPTGALERFIATKPGVKVNAPAAITKNAERQSARRTNGKPSPTIETVSSRSTIERMASL